MMDASKSPTDGKKSPTNPPNPTRPLSPTTRRTPKTPLTPKTPDRRFLFVSPTAYQKAQQIITHLQEENKKTIKDLLETTLTITTEAEHLSLFLEMFNQSILGALWRIKLTKLEQYSTLTEKQCNPEKGFIEDLTAYSHESDPQQRAQKGIQIFEKMVSECILHVPNSINITLKKNEGYENLIEDAQRLIEQIFDSMDDQKLTKFHQHFNNPIIIRMEEFADFLHRHPETMSTPEQEISDTDITNLSRAANNIKEAITTLKSALNNVERKRGLSYYPHPKIRLPSEQPEPSQSVQEYLLRHILGGKPEEKALLQNQLEQVIAVAAQIHKTSYKRSSISEGMPSVPPRRLQRILSSPEKEDLAREPHSASWEPPWKQDAPHDSAAGLGEEAIEVVALSLPLIKRKKKHYCSREHPEKLAALLTRNPFIKAVNGALSLRYSVSQILKIYPEARKAAFPYLGLIDVTGGLIGGWVGCHAILNPKKPLSTRIRVWEAWVEGSIVFVFTIGSAIKIYLALHPEENYISDVKFWTQIASTPIALQALYQGWYSIAPHTKARWFPEDSKKRHIASGLEILLRTFQYSRIFEMATLEFTRTSSQWGYHFIPVAPAFCVALGQRFTRYTERLTTLMTYLTSISLLTMLTKELLAQTKSLQEDPIMLYSRIGYWGALFIAANVFSIKQSIDFLAEYEGDPKIVIKKTRRKRDHTHTQINPEQFQTLEKIDLAPVDQEEDIQKRRRSLVVWMQDIAKSRAPTLASITEGSPLIQQDAAAVLDPTVPETKHTKKCPCSLL